MSFFLFLLRIVVLVGFVFFFMVLFQYGPENLRAGFAEEAAQLRSLLPSAAGADNVIDSPDLDPKPPAPAEP